MSFTPSDSVSTTPPLGTPQSQSVMDSSDEDMLLAAGDFHSDSLSTTSPLGTPQSQPIMDSSDEDILLLLAALESGNFQTGLHNAALGGSLEVVKFFISEKGCDPMCSGTPLHNASQEGHLDIVKYLIDEQHVDPSCLDEDEVIPLTLASENGHMTLVKYFTEEKHCDPLHRDKVGNTPLHGAALGGSLEVVRFFISEKGCDPMCRGQRGRTPLHYATRNGHIDIVKYLIDEQHVDPSCLDEEEVTPLHLAAIEGDVELVKYFSEKGCDPMCRGQWGTTPLHVASIGGHLDIVKYLIDEQHVDPSCLDEDEDTPLTLASENGHMTLVKYFTEEKHCDPLHRDKVGNTPLYGAALGGSLEVVRFFISEKGCDPMCRGRWGRTPLHGASQEGHLDIVKYLIDEQHVDPSCLDEDEATPLRLASSKGHMTLVKYFTEEKHCDPLHRDKVGNTPLHGAAFGGSLEVVRFFISEKGCDPMCRGQWDKTPLHDASQGGHLDIVKYLIDEQHVDPSCLDEEEVTPLHLAAIEGDVELVKYFSEKGCDPMCRGQWGTTPLHVASIGGHLDIVKYLIDEQHVDPSYHDSNRITPLHTAARNGHLEVVKYLVGFKHCNPAPVSIDEKTPFDLACECNHENVALYLISKGAGFSIEEYDMINTTPWKPLAPVVKVFVVGDSAAGKSILIKSLQLSVRGALFNIAGVSPSTVGIVPTEFNSKHFGEVTIYDFSGSERYHSSHQAVFESMTYAVVLVLVDLTLPPDEIVKTIGYWNFLIANGAFIAGCHVSLVAIGSHIDLLTNEELWTKSALLSATLSDFSHFKNLENAGWVALDCRKTVSPGMTLLHQVVQWECGNIRLKTEFDYWNGRILNAFITMLLSSICACTFNELLSHVCHNPHPDLEPLKSPTALYEVCESLNTSGHLILLKNKEIPEESWIILNKDAVLSKIHGLLGHIQITNKSGIITLSLLNDTIRKSKINLHTDMIMRYMLEMQFCTEIEPHSLIENSNLSQIEGKCFFFPSVISETRPDDVWKSSQTYSYYFGWGLKCTESSHFFTPRFLQVLLIQLASRFALKRHPESPGLLEPAQGCRLWKNGIYWLDQGGVEVIVEIINQSTSLNMILRCLNKDDDQQKETRMIQLRTSIIQQILNAKAHTCPLIEPKEYLLHPRCLQTYPMEEIYEIPLAGIAEAIVKKDPYLRIVDSDSPDNADFLSIRELLHFEPYQDLSVELLQQFFDKQETGNKMSHDTLLEIAAMVQNKWGILSELPHVTKSLVDRVALDRHKDPQKCLADILTFWFTRDGTYDSLRHLLDKYSIFAGRNPLDLCSIEVVQKELARHVEGSSSQDAVIASGDHDRPTVLLLQMMKTPSGAEVEIIKTLTPKWREFGCLLNLDPNGLTLDLIEAEKKDPGPCCEEMFQRWLTGKGKQPATWEVLIKLLEDAKYNYLAQQIKETTLPYSIREVPVITCHPEDVKKAIQGERVVFTCATGATKSDLKHSWEWNPNLEDKEGVEFGGPQHKQEAEGWKTLSADDSQFQGTDSTNLTITMVHKSKEGRYRCTIECNGTKVVSQPAILTIEVPVITCHPEDVKKAIQGERVVFTCATEATKSDLKYSWEWNPNLEDKEGVEFGGPQQKQEAEGWKTLSADDSQFQGTDSASLTITMVHKSNEGRYRCTIECNGTVIVSQPAILTIVEDETKSYLEAFERACEKDGRIPLKVVQCMFTGPPGGGKSSLKARLVKKRKPSAQSHCGSTGVANQADIAMVTDPHGAGVKNVQVSLQEWYELDITEQLIHLLLRTKQSSVIKDQRTKSCELETAISDDTKGERKCMTISPQGPMKEATPAAEIEHHLQVSASSVRDLPLNIKFQSRASDTLISLPEMLSEAVKSGNLEKVKQIIEGQFTVYFTDTGGQSVFQELLPAIISGLCIFFLVFNLENAVEGLDKKFPEEYKTRDGKILPLCDSTISTGGVIMETLASIAQVADAHSRLPETRVFLIGTHRDSEQVKGNIPRIDNELDALISKTDHYRMIVRASKNQLLFPVENIPLDGNDDDLKLIREKFITVAGQCAYKAEIPISWLAFDLLLRRQSAKQCTVLPKSQCVKMAQNCNILKKDAEQVLQFLHDRFGVVRYFKKKELNNTVIIHPQVIYDRITDLIVNGLDEDNTNPAVSDEFKQKGLFCVGDIERGSDSHDLSFRQVIALLQHLHIVSPVLHIPQHENKLFMPCVLTYANDPPNPLNPTRDAEKLLVIFDCHYIPRGVFSTLAAYLLSRNNKWRLNDKELYRNQISFRIRTEEDDYIVYIVAVQNRKLIEIFLGKYDGDATVLSQLRCTIRMCIYVALNNVLRSLNYVNCDSVDDALPFSFGFYTGCPGSTRHIGSLNKRESAERMECQDCSCIHKCVWMVKLDSHHLAWLEKGPSGSKQKSKVRESEDEAVSSSEEESSASLASPEVVKTTGKRKRHKHPKLKHSKRKKKESEDEAASSSEEESSASSVSSEVVKTTRKRKRHKYQKRKHSKRKKKESEDEAASSSEEESSAGLVSPEVVKTTGKRKRCKQPKNKPSTRKAKKDISLPPSKQPRLHRPAKAATSSQAGSRLIQKDLKHLFNFLKHVAHKWEHLGLELGFMDDEIKNIQATPTLLHKAPTSYLQELLAQWLKRAPPDHPYPTVTALVDALRNIGEERLANEFPKKFIQARGADVAASGWNE